jgi:hypothetical protein
MNEGYMQQRMKDGKRYSKRQGIYGGYLNRRSRASRKELTEWIKNYQKQMDQGTFCPKRGAKIIAHFQKLLDRLDCL